MQLAIAIPTRNDPTPVVLDALRIGVRGPVLLALRIAAQRAAQARRAHAFGDAVAAAAGAIDEVASAVQEQDAATATVARCVESIAAELTHVNTEVRSAGATMHSADTATDGLRELFTKPDDDASLLAVAAIDHLAFAKRIGRMLAGCEEIAPGALGRTPSSARPTPRSTGTGRRSSSRTRTATSMARMRASAAMAQSSEVVRRLLETLRKRVSAS